MSNTATPLSVKNPNVLRRSALAFALIVFGGLLALVLGLIIGGAAAATQLGDPGAVVRWGLPIAKFVTNFSTAIAVGSLIFAVFALPSDSPLLAKVQNLAAFAAGLWSIAGSLVFLFTYLSVSGSAFSTDPVFGESMAIFATQIELGQSLALNLAAALLLTVLALAFRSLTSTLFLAVLGIAALVPLALIGHAAGTANHAMAVNSIGIHLVAVVIWVGGLVALFISRGESAQQMSVLTRRYSSMALIAFVLVAISGLSSASIRINLFTQLGTAYGNILALKIGALALLGILGAAYRTRLIGKIADGANQAKALWSLIAVEFVIMGSAIGLATALARTAPPTDGQEFITPTPAQILTGEPLPPELTAIRWFTEWKIDILWLIIAVGAIGAYLLGVYRLKKRGDSWSWGRTASWITGMLVLIYVTSAEAPGWLTRRSRVGFVGSSHQICAPGVTPACSRGAFR